MESRQTKKELVRLLVIQHGQKIAADLSQVPYETVKKWTQRGKWLAPAKPCDKTLSPFVPSPAHTIKLAADNLQDELADNEKATKLSLSRYAKRAAADAENASLREAPYVKQAAQVAGIVHQWGEGKAAAHFSLNILNMGDCEVEVRQ